jgi:hypothetical protein
MTVPDSDRERVIAILREQAGEGRLDLDEFGQRLDEAYQAQSVEQLQHALRELPVPPVAEPAPPASAGATGMTGVTGVARRPDAMRPLPGEHRPVPRQGQHPAKAPGKVAAAAWHSHVTTYMAVNMFLIMIWLSTSGTSSFFWPMFPIGGWGIGVAAHGASYYSGRSRAHR